MAALVEGPQPPALDLLASVASSLDPGTGRDRAARFARRLGPVTRWLGVRCAHTDVQRIANILDGVEEASSLRERARRAWRAVLADRAEGMAWSPALRGYQASVGPSWLTAHGYVADSARLLTSVEALLARVEAFSSAHTPRWQMSLEPEPIEVLAAAFSLLWPRRDAPGSLGTPGGAPGALPVRRGAATAPSRLPVVSGAYARVMGPYALVGDLRDLLASGAALDEAMRARVSAWYARLLRGVHHLARLDVDPPSALLEWSLQRTGRPGEPVDTAVQHWLARHGAPRPFARVSAVGPGPLDGACRVVLEGYASAPHFVWLDAVRDAVLSADEAGVLRIWRASTGEPLAASQPRDRLVVACALAARAGSMAVACADGSVALWDLDSSRSVREVYVDMPGLTALAVDATGRRIAVGSQHRQVELWDWGQSRGPLGRVEVSAPVLGLAFGGGDDSSVCIWTRDGRVVRWWPAEERTTDESAEAPRRAMPEQEPLSAAAEDEGEGCEVVFRWREREWCARGHPDGTVALELRHRDVLSQARAVREQAGAITCLDADPGGARLSAGDSTGEIRIYDLETLRRAGALPPQAPAIVCGSTQGDRIVTVGPLGAVARWRPRTRDIEASATPRAPDAVVAAAADARAAVVAVASASGRIDVWDLDDECHLASLEAPGGAACLAVQPSQVIAPTAQGVGAWAVPSAERTWTATLPFGRPRALAAHPDAPVLAALGGDGQVAILRSEDGHIVAQREVPTGAASLAWASEATLVVEAQGALWTVPLSTGDPQPLDAPGAVRTWSLVPASRRGDTAVLLVATREGVAWGPLGEPLASVWAPDWPLVAAVLAGAGTALAAVDATGRFYLGEIVEHGALGPLARRVWTGGVDAASWHPGRPFVAMALDGGDVLVCRWHGPSGVFEQIRRIAGAFPANARAVRIAWSQDGRALRVDTPAGTHVIELAPRAAPPTWCDPVEVSADGAWRLHAGRAGLELASRR